MMNVGLHHRGVDPQLAAVLQGARAKWKKVCPPELACIVWGSIVDQARVAGGLKTRADMRKAFTTLIGPLATLFPHVAAVHAADTFTGSGVVIGTRGEILTNAHVVEGCKKITVQMFSQNSQAAVLVARDQQNDLAVVRVNNPPPLVAAFREGTPLRAGDTVVALGFPLSGLLATTANLTVGNVSALAGLGDDTRYFQISAPVQPGNSGGPLLDASGHLVGIVTSKLNAAGVARVTGDIPQNVNFAIKAEVTRTFLDSKGIDYRAARSDQQLSPADVGEMARPFTVYIECEQAPSRSIDAGVVAPPVAAPDSLLATIGSVSHWAKGGACGDRNLAYSLTVGNGFVTWRSGRGNTDIESILSSGENDFRTRTTNSPSVKIGQIWIYTKIGPSEMMVTEAGRRAFNLVRCQ
jgi:S1-C subfamily serine protease